MTPMLKAAVVLIALLSLGFGACEREQKSISQDLPAARATKARTASGVTGGPFLARVPTPPTGFSPYQYAKQGDINFSITSTAGAVTVTAP